MKKALISTAGAAALLLAPAAYAAWTFKVMEDPMTDAKRGISLAVGEGGGVAVKCDSNGPGSLYLSFISDKYLGSLSGRNKRPMRFRIDKGEPGSIEAYYDGKTASLFDVSPTKAGGEFLSQLLDSSSLVVEVLDYDWRPQTIVLDTTGTREAVKKSAAACQDTEWSAL